MTSSQFLNNFLLSLSQIKVEQHIDELGNNKMVKRAGMPVAQARAALFVLEQAGNMFH